jgi:23S rRNA pseudouridine1911/1915/1917 synthase
MADLNQIDPSGIKTIYEDQHLLVLSKPAGLLSQGDISGDENLVDVLRARFGRNYVGLVHRLDRNTTGLMVVAKRSKAAERLTSQLQSGELVRQYHAILFGKFEGVQRWEHSLLKNESTNEVRVVSPNSKGAKLAVLKASAVKNLIHPQTQDLLTLAKFELETGRSHQIRVQSAAMHHPLIGDTKYGSAKSLTLFSRPALHSCFLAFTHPLSKEKLEFHERYSADMQKAFSTQLE